MKLSFDESSIIAMAVSGDRETFGILYRHYHSEIFRWIFERIHESEITADLTHDVFLRALQKISSYQDQGFPFSSWLYRIARNRVIDYYRNGREWVNIDHPKL